MKVNFRHVVAGTALALMASVSFAATVSLPGGAVKYSKEGLGLQGGDVTLPQIDVVLGNNYTYQDDIIIQITGGGVLTANTVPTILCGAATVIGFVQQLDNTSYNFRVTDQNGINSGTTCAVNGLKVTAASLSAAGSLGVTWTGKRFVTGQVIDSGSTTSNQITVADQLTIKVTKALDAVINVESSPPRTAFTAGNDTTTTDTLVLAITATATGFTPPTVDATTETITLTGDFSWTDGTDTNTTCDTTELSTYVTSGGTYTLSAGNCGQVVLTRSGAALGDITPTITIAIPTGTAAKILSPQVFGGSIKWDYKLTGGAATGSKTVAFSPGAWSINGAFIQIAYMPYGDGISQIIWLAHKGLSTVDVTVDYFTDTGAKGSFVLPGAAVAGKVSALAGAIKAKLEAAGFTTGKAHLTLTMPTSDRNIEVYSAYNVGGTDRGNVVNNSNGRSFFYGTGYDFSVLAP